MPPAPTRNDCLSHWDLLCPIPRNLRDIRTVFITGGVIMTASDDSRIEVIALSVDCLNPAHASTVLLVCSAVSSTPPCKLDLRKHSLIRQKASCSSIDLKILLNASNALDSAFTPFG